MIKNKNIWIYLTAVSLAVLITVEIYSDRLIGSNGSTNEQMKLSTSLVMLVAAITLVVSIISVLKTKKISRVFAVFSCLISLIVFGYAFFAYGFIGYGS